MSLSKNSSNLLSLKLLDGFALFFAWFFLCNPFVFTDFLDIRVIILITTFIIFVLILILFLLFIMTKFMVILNFFNLILHVINIFRFTGYSLRLLLYQIPVLVISAAVRLISLVAFFLRLHKFNRFTARSSITILVILPLILVKLIKVAWFFLYHANTLDMILSSKEFLPFLLSLVPLIGRNIIIIKCFELWIRFLMSGSPSLLMMVFTHI